MKTLFSSLPHNCMYTLLYDTLPSKKIRSESPFIQKANKLIEEKLVPPQQLSVPPSFVRSFVHSLLLLSLGLWSTSGAFPTGGNEKKEKNIFLALTTTRAYMASCLRERE